MDFIFYDLFLLVVFAIFVSIFLYKNKKNLKREGLLFLYRTSWGMKLIEKIGKKYKKALGFLSYASITVGYLLMAGMLYFFGKMVYIYVSIPEVVEAIKVPPIMPLVPYLPKAFELNLPPFYFTYWIIILAIIAVFHEFSHGIFMKKHGIKIKSTGFGFFPFFLPVFLAAFVEQDEKSMEKKSPFKQMAVLSAGTFANLLTAILASLLLAIFFSLSFSPAGVDFDTYSYSMVPLGSVTGIGNMSVENMTQKKLVDNIEENTTRVRTVNHTYLLDKSFLEKQRNKGEFVLMYNDAPAIKNNLEGAIGKIDGETIKSLEKLNSKLSEYSPGENVSITMIKEEETLTKEITLEEHPEKDKAWLGVAFRKSSKDGIVSKAMNLLISYRDKNVYYEPGYGAAEYFYYLLWWLVLVSFTVALVNMLPVGIFDGGRFFYLTVYSFTKSEKKAKKWFKYSTNLILFLLLVLMATWVINLI